MPTSESWTTPALRVGLALAGIALALVTIVQDRALRGAREEAHRWLERSGVTRDASALGREPDPERVRLRAARAVLAAELDPNRHQGIPAERAARESSERMAEAARQAREILARRPASWEASMVLGAATYLGWAQSRDPRLFQDYRQWEAPLAAALRLAPSRREPARFLAAAYLEVWPALSPAKRETARRLLAGVFRDPEDLGRLIGPWLDTAADRREVFSVLPDDPAVWERVSQAYIQRGDLDGFAAARERQEETLLARLHRDLLEADRLRGRGELAEARTLYLSVATRARPEARYLGLLEQALERCPPGPVRGETAKRLEPHLERALERCQLSGCDLEPAALKRLARLVHDQAPPQAALAALYSDDLPRATLYERRTEGLGTEPWAAYLIAKSRWLAARERTDEAREALALVHPAWRNRALFWEAGAEVAVAAGDLGRAAEARKRLASLSRPSWPATAWTWRRGVARLEMVLTEPADGFAVTLDEVPANGSVVELRLDGAALAGFPVRPGETGSLPTLRAATPLRRGIHILEVATRDGGRVLPGGVELR